MTDILDDSYESDLTEEEHQSLVLMSEHAIAKPLMTPQEAGFDGLNGIRIDLPQLPDGFVFKPRRGSTPPWKTKTSYPNQLFWQQSTPPRLLYCNNDGEWFELSFTPIKT